MRVMFPIAFSALVVSVPAVADIPPQPLIRGATIGDSGFATILGVPPGITTMASAPASPPPPPTNGHPTPLPMTREARAARSRMMNPDRAARDAAQMLDKRLSVAERGNYIGLRIVRDPTPRPAFQFRRNAAATLARYTRDPRFTSREGGIPRAELQPIFDAWWKRFEPFRLVGGGAVNEFDGVVRFDMNIDEAGFREIAARERWTLPARLDLRFGPPRNPRSIDPALVRYVRIFARQDRWPAVVHDALLSGRVILRDGCFRLAEHDESGEPLVIFGRDVELGLDDQNYMVLKNTGSGRAAPRIGERMMWGGPRGYSEADPNVMLLRAKCGTDPIVAVGEPDSDTRASYKAEAPPPSMPSPAPGPGYTGSAAIALPGESVPALSTAPYLAVRSFDPDIALLALARGKLVVRDGCIRLVGKSGGGGALVIWPTGSRLITEGRRQIIIKGRTGQRFTVGSRVQLGGGGSDSFPLKELTKSLPAQCSGPYFSAN